MAGKAQQIGDLYRQYLGRSPDPGGLTNYVNLLNSGRSLDQIARDLQQSPEGRAYASRNAPGRAQQIGDMYRQYLGRNPDQGGLQHYVTSGRSIDQIRQDLIGSPEGRAYASRNATPTPVPTQKQEQKPKPVPTQTRAPRTLAEAIAYGERAEKAGVDPDEAAKNYIAQREQDEVRKILQTSPYQSTGERLGAVGAKLGNEFARKYLEDTAPKPTPVPTPAPVQNVAPPPTTQTPAPTPSPKPKSEPEPRKPTPVTEPLPEPEGPPDYDYMRKLKSIGVKLPKSPAQQQRRGGGTAGAFGRKGLRITSLNLA